MAEEKNQKNEDEVKDKLSDTLIDKKNMEEKPSDASADAGSLDDKKSFEDKYKRALADYQNLLKQTVKEKMEFAMFANELMLKEILPVYDHLKMAIEHHNGESSDNWLEGIKHVVKQFKDVLEKQGVREVKTKDQEFDHNTMEAISNEETDNEELDGKVAKQMKAGYTLNGKIVEAAKVVIYKVKIE